MGKDFLKSNSELKSGHLEFAVSHPYRDEYPLRKASSYQSGRESVFWTEHGVVFGQKTTIFIRSLGCVVTRNGLVFVIL